MIFGKAWKAYGNIDRGLGLIATLSPFTLSIITAVASIWKQVDWHLVIFYSVGVLGFWSMFLFYISQRLSAERIKGLVLFDKISSVNIIQQEANLIAITPLLIVSNRSKVPVYIQPELVQIILQDKSKPIEHSGPKEAIAPPSGEFSLICPTIGGLDPKGGIKGVAKLTYRYGLNKGEYTNKCSVEAEIVYEVNTVAPQRFIVNTIFMFNKIDDE